MAYVSVTDMRGEEGIEDFTAFPEAEVTAAIALAEVEIDRFTFTSFEYKAFAATLDGNNSRCITIRTDEGYPILHPRTLASVTIDSVAQTTTNWAVHPEGIVIRDEGVFTYNKVGRNVVISGTAGLQATPDATIKWATRKLARFHLLNDVNRTEDRALSMASDYGNIMLAHASNNPERPTALPEVNARLAKYRQMTGGAFS